MLHIKNKTESEQKHQQLTHEQIAEETFRHIKPNTIDIVHYAFNYVGVLAGIYYKQNKSCFFSNK